MAELRRRWSQWTAVVEGYARRRRGRRVVDTDDYRVLHQRLLTTCHSLAVAGDPTARSFYLNLEGLLRPWMVPRVLEQADRDILFDLLGRCEQAGRELGCSRRLRLLRPWMPRVAGLAAVVGVLALVLWSAERFWMPAVGYLSGLGRASWFVFRRSIDTQWLIVAGIVFILIAMYIVARDVRR